MFEELEDFTVEPLEVSSLQPELQTIANSLTTTTFPAVHKLLIIAFQALQVDIVEKASLIPEQDDAYETKRSCSNSLDPFSSSPTKKLRLLLSDSMSSEDNGIEYWVSSNKGGCLDLILNGEKPTWRTEVVDMYTREKLEGRRMRHRLFYLLRFPIGLVHKLS